MPTPEKFSLRWNDFQENINTVFRDLRKDLDFTDVTLASEDGQQVEAHKVILAASSPFFQNLLKKNRHAHPLIYMRGMKSEDLLAIIDFLYYGKASIYQENLDTFLNIAEEFQLKGLNKTEDGGGGGEEDVKKYTAHSHNPVLQGTKTHAKSDISKTTNFSQNNSFTSKTKFEDQIPSSAAVSPPKIEFSGDMKELDEKVESLMSRGEHMIRLAAKKMTRAYACKVCGREGSKRNIKNHIEAIHLDGISIPCNLCEKTLTSRYSLGRHNSRVHRDSK